jgi:hypothetical protein
MMGSVIHTAFEPLPYVLFSLASITTGLLIEVRTTLKGKGRPSRLLPQRSIAAECRGNSSPRHSHPLDCLAR